MRINKYLSLTGVASRRQADKLILQKKIFINGNTAVIGDTINPTIDKITFDGKNLSIPNKLEYYLLNKPAKVLSASFDSKQETVLDLIDKTYLFPVGRLDYDSTGLIILTNDGDLALKLTHPRYHVPKTYRVQVRENITKNQLQKLSNGIKLKEGTTKPAIVKPLNTNTFEITLHQGFNRQIRRMCGIVGLTVEELERISIGPITSHDLQSGEFRRLSVDEISQLKSLI